MTAERRRDARFSVDQIVEVSFGKEAFVHGTGINLSKTGVLCKTDSYMEPYSQVSLLMTVPVGPEGHRFTCEGVVVRTEREGGDYLTGISFTSIDDEDSRKLQNFLKKQKGESNKR